MAQSRLILPILALSLAAQALPARAIELPFGLGGGRDRAAAQPVQRAPEVRMAQAGDGGVRLAQVEEEMRRLTGKVEELGFLVLQLQEQLRKTQEDNEFRFQDLEKGSGGGGANASAPQRKTEVAPTAAPPAAPGATTPAPATSSRVASVAPPSANDATASRAAAVPAPADEIGALLNGAAVSQPLPSTEPSVPPSDKVASIRTEGPVELYSLGYNYMLAGDYHLAETTFRQYTQTYPTSSDAPDAQYWLGEALYAQAKYRDAAEVFLNAQKANPQAPKAPEMMLKLGMSLARLDNRETACVTYGEVSRRYPAMSANVKRKLQAEEKSASCS